MTDSCANCHFYRKLPLRPGEGTCRKKSPAVLLMPAGNSIAPAKDAWPPVNETGWCGKHKTKTNGHAVEN